MIVWEVNMRRRIDGIQWERRTVEGLANCAVAVLSANWWTMKSDRITAEAGGFEDALWGYLCHRRWCGKALNYRFLGRIVRRTEGNCADLARSSECHPTTFITDVLSPSQPDFLGIDNFSNHPRRLYCQSNSPKLPLENIRLSPQRWQASAGIFVRRQHFGLANFACRPSYYCSSQVFPKIVF